MKLKDAHGMVLSVLKHIYIKQPKEYICAMHFPPEKGQVEGGLSSSNGTDWWTTWTTKIALENMAIALKKFNATLEAGALETYSECILELIHELSADKALFSSNIMAHSRQCSTLFDAVIVKNKSELSAQLYSLFEKSCLDSIESRIVGYPLWGIHGPSFNIKPLGLNFVSTANPIAPSGLEEYSKGLGKLDLRAGTWGRNRFGESNPSAWLFYEAVTCKTNAGKFAAKSFKLLLALLFSLSAETYPLILNDTEKTQSSRILLAAKSGRCSFLPVEPLMPPITIKYQITEATIRLVQRWMEHFASAAQEQKQRALVSSDFLHRAFFSKGVEEFVFLFIALDGLYGLRGKVERSILDAISQLDPAGGWRSRGAKLFDLRSELIHGSAASLQEWSGLSAYLRQYKSYPKSDLQKITCRAFNQFFLNQTNLK
jgi:hypothetical protein